MGTSRSGAISTSPAASAADSVSAAWGGDVCYNGGNSGGNSGTTNDGIGFGHLDSLFDSSSDDTITLDNVSATRANIFTGFSSADTISITDSNFNDLGVVLGNGSGSLSITGTTTTHSTTLIGLGSSNTYTDGGGNSFANLHTHGFSPAPTARPSWRQRPRW